MGDHAIANLEDLINRKIELAKTYTDGLKNVEGLSLPQSPREGDRDVYSLFMIQHEERDLLQKYLSERGIQSGVHYPIPIHLQTPGKNVILWTRSDDKK